MDLNDLGSVRLSETLDYVLGAFGQATVTIHSEWASIVGDEAAAASTPGSIKNGTLHVTVTQPVWATQLQWMEPDIVKAVNELGGDTVSKINISVKRGRGGHFR